MPVLPTYILLYKNVDIYSEGGELDMAKGLDSYLPPSWPNLTGV